MWHFALAGVNRIAPVPPELEYLAQEPKKMVNPAQRSQDCLHGTANHHSQRVSHEDTGLGMSPVSISSMATETILQTKH